MTTFVPNEIVLTSNCTHSRVRLQSKCSGWLSTCLSLHQGLSYIECPYIEKLLYSVECMQQNGCDSALAHWHTHLPVSWRKSTVVMPWRTYQLSHCQRADASCFELSQNQRADASWFDWIFTGERIQVRLSLVITRERMQVHSSVVVTRDQMQVSLSPALQVAALTLSSVWCQSAHQRLFKSALVARSTPGNQAIGCMEFNSRFWIDPVDFIVISLYDDCVYVQQMCPDARLSLLNSLIAVKMQWIVRNFFVLTSRLSLQSMASCWEVTVHVAASLHQESS